MVVSWLTPTPSASTVKFGDGGEDVRVAVGETLRYTIQSIARNTTLFANYTSGVVHHARLTNLLPDTQYFYQVV
jgi:phosphodiesterase/alkaline phosphatase D-like protein